MGKSFTDSYQLNDDKTIPVMGFGTAGLKGQKAERSVAYALELGYRLVDTSPNYGNEADVGKGIQTALKRSIRREDLFVLTKVEREDMSADGVRTSLEESLARLNLDYLDLLIIHAPDDEDPVNIDTWKGLEAVLETGKVRSIGVSNFTPDNLGPLLENAAVKPVINQVKFAPGTVDWETKAYCESRSIFIMAYSPIKKGKLDSDVIRKLAKKYKKTPEQIALRWTIEAGTIPIPRSGNKDHIKENADLFNFSLTENEIKAVNELS
ncbi:Aldo/keto reductase [Alkalibacterium subtropicum]|uniref:Aldo/keto reductase n=1 Tax=Alkalibacterium subtropicum TaxID=753702 RepID=A0A1I1GT11_9LACT|nr:aldo/keto reductase [Alkalibacterium subtropicum]SFC12170.1 Aldo/keto reductase [Alkalibacterium subtropicum]